MAHIDAVVPMCKKPRTHKGAPLKGPPPYGYSLKPAVWFERRNGRGEVMNTATAMTAEQQTPLPEG